MYYERLTEICRQNGTTPTALLKKLGLSTSKVTAWKNGSIPKADVIKRISDELGVPVSAFFDDGVASTLPDDELELIEIYRQLAKSGKRQLIGKAYELLDSQNNPQVSAEATPPDIDMVAPVLDRRIKK